MISNPSGKLSNYLAPFIIYHDIGQKSPISPPPPSPRTVTSEN